MITAQSITERITLRTKLLMAFGIVILLSVFFGVYVITQLNAIFELSREVDKANRISQSALQLHSEHFHTQLEVFKFALGPTEEKYNAYIEHRTLLLERINEFTTRLGIRDGIGASEFGITSTNLTVAEDLKRDVIQAVSYWDNSLVPHGRKLQRALENGTSLDVIQQLEADIAHALQQSELLFDSVVFDKELDTFLTGQENIIEQLSKLESNSIQNLITSVVVFVLSIFAISFSISFYVASNFSGQVKKFLNTVQEISRGDIRKRVAVTSKDEIGELAEAFNEMAETIEDTYEALTIKTEETTSTNKQLEEKVHELEKFQKLTVGREMTMIELKAEAEALKKRIADLQKEHEHV